MNYIWRTRLPGIFAMRWEGLEIDYPAGYIN
jgi:hypothetical protein